MSVPATTVPPLPPTQTSTTTDHPAAVDGRRLRGERSRNAVVDALLDLYAEGVIRPGTAEIARRAGVSERSVFRHFDDLDSLVEAATARQFERIGHLFAMPEVAGSRAARVESLVAQRLAIHDAASGAIRAGTLLVPEAEPLRATFAARRRLLRDQVEQLFARELATRAPADRVELLEALAAVAGLEHIEHLRHDLGLSRSRTARIVTRSITALLQSKAPEDKS